MTGEQQPRPHNAMTPATVEVAGEAGAAVRRGPDTARIGAVPAVAPTTTIAPAPRLSENDPLWFKRAVLYELLVRAFQDSNNDGIGDFPGLISRLDYLQWLGVDCIWLLPFNQSPLRDGGYDIS